MPIAVVFPSATGVSNFSGIFGVVTIVGVPAIAGASAVVNIPSVDGVSTYSGVPAVGVP